MRSPHRWRTKQSAALAFTEPAVARAQVALHAPVVRGVPPPRGELGVGAHAASYSANAP